MVGVFGKECVEDNMIISIKIHFKLTVERPQSSFVLSFPEPMLYER